jgi:hypothetical protein
MLRGDIFPFPFFPSMKSPATLAPVAFLATMLALCAPRRAEAALVAYEDFESYAAGTALSGDSGGTGWTANWAAVSGVNAKAATLSYSNGSVVVAGGSLSGGVDDATNNTSAASRSFAAQTGTVYMSLLMAMPVGLDSDDFIHFMFNNDTVNTNSGGFGKINQTDTRLGARIGTGNGGGTTNSTVSFTGTDTFFLVGKISKVASTNYNRLDFYINPSSQTEPGTANAVSSADSGISTISFFSMRTVSLEALDRVQFDELRFGTTFADVVPEPTTGVLMMLGAMLLGSRIARGRRMPRARFGTAAPE